MEPSKPLSGSRPSGQPEKGPKAGQSKMRKSGSKAGGAPGSDSPDPSAGPRMGRPPAAGSSVPIRAQLSRTWRHGCRMLFRDQPRLTLVYMVLFLLSSIAMMVVPQLFGEITNTLHQNSAQVKDGAQAENRLVWLYVAWAVFLLAARPLMSLLVQLTTVKLDNRLGIDLGQRLFRTLLDKPLPFFHQRDIGSLTFLLRDMSIQAQMAIRQLTLDPILMVLSLVAGLAFVIYNYFKLSGGEPSLTSWLIVAGLLVLGLVSPLLVSRFAPGLQAASKDMRDRQAALAALLQGALQSPEEVQSFNAVPFFGDKHLEAMQQLNQTREKQTFAVEKVNFFNKIPSDLTQVLLVGAAILIVFASGSVDRIGSLVAILLLVPQLMRPIQGLSSVIVSLKTSWPAIEAVLDIVESGEPPATPDARVSEQSPTTSSKDLITRPITELFSDDSPAIVGHELRFRYRPDLAQVFDGASFSIPRNRISTIVARMGQGKTTLFRLLLRFYAPESGELLIGDTPLDQIDPKQLRRDIALLSQFPAFTHDSVRDNFRMAAPDADDAHLLATCRATGMLDILNAKLGVGSRGEGGNDLSREADVLDVPFASGTILSGGQRRLFALTRCLLRDPAVLLLDEPTTGLDNAEKASLIPVLREICAGKTVVIVDHDTRWIHRVCDHFVILEDARTTDYGDRDSVLSESRLFGELYHQNTDTQADD